MLIYDTSHLLGLFHRTLRMCDNGIKPAYVFDGKPPQLKSNEVCDIKIKNLKDKNNKKSFNVLVSSKS